jgi:hypothetical protein
MAVQKFPSLDVDRKRNATKRRKRDKAIPPHELATSASLKFKAFHFAPLFSESKSVPGEPSAKVKSQRIEELVHDNSFQPEKSKDAPLCDARPEDAQLPAVPP